MVILRRHLHELLILTPYQKSQSLQKQLTFCSTTTGFPAKGWLRNKPRNSILMMYLTQIWVVLLIGWSKFLTNIGSSTQIWVGDFALIPVILGHHFAGKPVVALQNACWLFSQISGLADMNKLPQIHKIGDSATWIKVQAEIANLESFMENKHRRSLEISWLNKNQPAFFINILVVFVGKIILYLPGIDGPLLARKIKAYK